MPAPLERQYLSGVTATKQAGKSRALNAGGCKQPKMAKMPNEIDMLCPYLVYAVLESNFVRVWRQAQCRLLL